MFLSLIPTGGDDDVVMILNSNIVSDGRRITVAYLKTALVSQGEVDGCNPSGDVSAVSTCLHLLRVLRKQTVGTGLLSNEHTQL